jgi:anthranilate/para-aminobenzoate synthase component I
LPLAACRVRPAKEPPATAGPHSIGQWEATWDEDGYAAAVTSVREAIEAGDVYQVIKARPLLAAIGAPRMAEVNA